MARIRSVKPSFYRHELLQELEVSHTSLKPMLVFSGLWTLADKEGRFEWRPKLIHLDILPFIEFDMERSLGLLEEHGFIRSYSSDGKRYGHIVTFKDHQRITGKEFDSESHLPIPPEDIKKKPGNIRETPEKRPGAQEREREREEEGNGLLVAIIGYLNEKTGKRFTPKSSDTAKHIAARIHEGRTLEDFKRVVDVKCSKWKGKTWNDTRPGREGQIVHGDDFLCPATLFCAKNFETYLNETPAASKMTSEEFRRQGEAEFKKLRGGN